MDRQGLRVVQALLGWAITRSIRLMFGAFAAIWKRAGTVLDRSQNNLAISAEMDQLPV
jgi:hypothetical protein